MIKVRAIKLLSADAERGAVTSNRVYTSHDGLECKEIYRVQRESDYVNEYKFRVSPDNGKSYGEWQNAERKNYSEMFGEDELITDETKRAYNSVYGHYVYSYWSRFFIGGHKEAYRALWKEGKKLCFDHQYIAISDTLDGNMKKCQFIKFEDGDDFSRENPRNPAFLGRNEGCLNAPIALKNGNILVPVELRMDKACEILGLDVNEIFPSCPHLAGAPMVARGVYNKDKEEYEFSFSKPLVISDLESSRGFSETILEELSSGRIILITRGSNVQFEPWNTRIEKGVPSYKWFSYSDDGGKSFAPISPWRFDTGEPVYSSATISEFIRSKKTGKLYWVGNVTDENSYGNFPRFPLYISEVDDASGLLKKDTLTVIDTRREGESERVQLSNFTLIEDRETGDLEVSLAKIGQFDGTSVFCAETWRYIITVD